MSDLDYDALRKVAEAATPGPWHSPLACSGSSVKQCVCSGGAVESGDEVAPIIRDRDAEHIAAFDPPTVLRLLDLAQRADQESEVMRLSLPETGLSRPNVCSGRSSATDVVRGSQGPEMGDA